MNGKPLDVNVWANMPAPDLGVEEMIDVSELRRGECIGAGGSGSVFRGSYKGEVVAIKSFCVVERARLSDSHLKMFVREVNALQKLQHPSLVRFYGACVDPQQMLCVVTEYLDGGNLFEVLHVKKLSLKPATRLRLGLQMVEGVSFLHSRAPPVIHRDIKSHNVVVQNVMGPGLASAKIIDYGLAESLSKSHLTLPEGKGVQGSAGYMAPECFQAPVRLSVKVDVWAIGCILVELFGGKTPHSDCDNIAQVVTKLLVHKRGPEVPDCVDATIGGKEGDHTVRILIGECFDFSVNRRMSSSDLEERLREVARCRGLQI